MKRNNMKYLFIIMSILISCCIVVNIYHLAIPHKPFLIYEILNIVTPFITLVFLVSILVTKMKH